MNYGPKRFELLFLFKDKAMVEWLIISVWNALQLCQYQVDLHYELSVLNTEILRHIWFLCCCQLFPLRNCASVCLDI